MSKFLLAPLFANARTVDVSKFRVENTAILRLRPRKLIFLLFSQIKGFLRDQLTSDYLSTQKLFMDKKWRKSIFQLLPLVGRYFLTVALKRPHFAIFCIKLLMYLFFCFRDSSFECAKHFEQDGRCPVSYS